MPNWQTRWKFFHLLLQRVAIDDRLPEHTQVLCLLVGKQPAVNGKPLPVPESLQLCSNCGRPQNPLLEVSLCCSKDVVRVALRA